MPVRFYEEVTIPTSVAVRSVAQIYTQREATPTMGLPYLACMSLVASLYQLPPRVLPSIQAVEGGFVGSISSNANGSQDLGVMQINTVWLPALSTYTGLDTHAVRERLIHQPCFNITAAGAILRLNLDQSGGDLMQAIGNYHSRTPHLHQRYRLRVLQAASRLFHGRAVAEAAGDKGAPHHRP